MTWAAAAIEARHRYARTTTKADQRDHRHVSAESQEVPWNSIIDEWRVALRADEINYSTKTSFFVRAYDVRKKNIHMNDIVKSQVVSSTLEEEVDVMPSGRFMSVRVWCPFPPYMFVPEVANRCNPSRNTMRLSAALFSL